MSGAKEIVKREGFVTCLSCGQTSLTFVLVCEGGGMSKTARCPKCSNTAYTQNLVGLWAFMAAVAEKVARINLDLIDLQDDGEDR